MRKPLRACPRAERTLRNRMHRIGPAVVSFTLAVLLGACDALTGGDDQVTVGPPMVSEPTVLVPPADLGNGMAGQGAAPMAGQGAASPGKARLGVAGRG